MSIYAMSPTDAAAGDRIGDACGYIADGSSGRWVVLKILRLDDFEYGGYVEQVVRLILLPVLNPNLLFDAGAPRARNPTCRQNA